MHFFTKTVEQMVVDLQCTWSATVKELFNGTELLKYDSIAKVMLK